MSTTRSRLSGADSSRPTPATAFGCVDGVPETWVYGSFHRNSTEGLSRRSRGSAEVHTAQSHPTVGTPIEVPVPRNVSFPCIGESNPIACPVEGEQEAAYPAK